MAERASRDQWRERVRRWRRSGKSADDFAAEIGVKPSTLTWWAWKVGETTKSGGSRRQKGRRRKRSVRSSSAAPVSFVALQSTEPEPDVAVEVSLSNGHRLRVGRGSDAAMVERVLGTLLEAR